VRPVQTNKSYKTAGESAELVNEPKTKPVAAPKKTSKSIKKPDTKDLASTDDEDYIDLPEIKDSHNGGKKMSPVLLKTSRVCQLKGDDGGKKKVRCIGSAGCHMTWFYPRDQNQVLKHVMGCGYAAMMKRGSQLVQEAIKALAAKDPNLLAELTKSIGEKRALTVVDVEEDFQQSLKRKKIDLSHTSDGNTTPAKSSTSISGDEMTAFKTEGCRVLEQDGNKALVEFIICCGLPPNILMAAAFKHFIESLKTRYILPSHTTFEDSLVPKYAAALWIAIISR